MRQPKPYLRKQTGSWYVQIGKKQILLGRDKEQAFQKYHDIMAGRGRSNVTYTSVPHLLDDYLAWVQENRAEATYKKLLHYLNSFAQYIGAGFTINQLEPHTVVQWVAQQNYGSSATGHDAVSIVQRAFNWAAKRGHIDRSPITSIPDKPRKTRSETVYTPDEWQVIRSHVKDQAFGDLLDFLWSTGCRPLEARTMCARHVDLDNGMVVFPPSEAKGKEHERVIFLVNDALEICQRLVPEHPDGYVLLNTAGNPWTKDAINCRFQRLKKKIGKPMNAYAIRHSFATEALKQGMDSLTLAQLMGHSDTSMLAKHYAHLARNPQYLRQQAAQLNRGSQPNEPTCE